MWGIPANPLRSSLQTWTSVHWAPTTALRPRLAITSRVASAACALSVLQTTFESPKRECLHPSLGPGTLYRSHDAQGEAKRPVAPVFTTPCSSPAPTGEPVVKLTTNGTNKSTWQKVQSMKGRCTEKSLSHMHTRVPY